MPDLAEFMAEGVQHYREAHEKFIQRLNESWRSKGKKIKEGIKSIVETQLIQNIKTKPSRSKKVCLLAPNESQIFG